MLRISYQRVEVVLTYFQKTWGGEGGGAMKTDLSENISPESTTVRPIKLVLICDGVKVCRLFYYYATSR